MDEKSTAMRIRIATYALLASILLWAGVLEAHVGSPGVVYEGKAGPYKLMVSVNPPDVIPGTAQVQIYIESGRPDNIWIKPIYWYAGDEGSPSPDPANPVPGGTGQYEGLVWLMSSGAASLEIHVEGPEGEGVAQIPLMAAATAQKEMEPGLGITLAILGLLLVVLMATIVGASVSDGIQSPVAEKRPVGKRLKGITISLAIMSLILYGGASWWNNWAEDYKRYMYKPFQADSRVYMDDNSHPVLEFNIDPDYQEYRGNSLSPVYMVADHGKIMHMFVMKEGSMNAFAHLHPR